MPCVVIPHLCLSKAAELAASWENHSLSFMTVCFEVKPVCFKNVMKCYAEVSKNVGPTTIVVTLNSIPFLYL